MYGSPLLYLATLLIQLVLHQWELAVSLLLVMTADAMLSRSSTLPWARNAAVIVCAAAAAIVAWPVGLQAAQHLFRSPF